MPTLELITWEGCPSTDEALALISRAELDLGLKLSLTRREINDYEEAQVANFVGSPTFRVEGRDLFDTAGQRAGLTCRIYHKPGGKFGPLPDFEEFKQNLSTSIKSDREANA